MGWPAMVKAESSFAVLAIIRHRSARLVSILGATILGLTAWQGSASSEAARQLTGLAVLSTLSVVWSSRLLAPGGALEAARTAGARWWIAPVGRMLGLTSLLVPVVLVVSLVLQMDGVVFGFLTASLVLAVTLGSFTMALTPFVGSSGAASVGFLLTLLGGVTPDTIGLILSQGPIEVLATGLWGVLPLQWRAELWLQGSGNFLFVSVLWFATSIGFAAAAVGWRDLIGRWR